MKGFPLINQIVALYYYCIGDVCNITYVKRLLMLRTKYSGKFAVSFFKKSILLCKFYVELRRVTYKETLLTFLAAII